MPWTVLNRTRTADGILLEVAGSKTDADGKPMRTATVLIPVDDPTPDNPAPLTPQQIATLQAKGLQVIRQQYGDGDTTPLPARTRLTVARDTAKRVAAHPVTTHSAAAGGAVLIADLLVHLL